MRSLESLRSSSSSNLSRNAQPAATAPAAIPKTINVVFDLRLTGCLLSSRQRLRSGVIELLYLASTHLVHLKHRMEVLQPKARTSVVHAG